MFKERLLELYQSKLISGFISSFNQYTAKKKKDIPRKLSKAVSLCTYKG